MRIVACCALHYGLSYLRWSIRSVIDYVDVYQVIHSKHGCHSGLSDKTPLEHPDELYKEARLMAGNKLEWYSADFANEGVQRDTIYELTNPDDIILVVDSDEIWQPLQLECLLDTVQNSGNRYVRARGVHFWRSFWRAVTDDFAAPTRAINRRYDSGETTADAYFAHMGYAIPLDVMRYKWSGFHGHQAELRPNFLFKYENYALIDVHPTNENYWNPVTVNALDYMPQFMAEHPYFDKAVIE